MTQSHPVTMSLPVHGGPRTTPNYPRTYTRDLRKHGMGFIHYNYDTSSRNCGAGKKKTTLNSGQEHGRLVHMAQSRGETPSMDQTDRCDSGDPTIDLCATTFDDGVDDDTVVLTGNEAERQKSAVMEAYDRGKWLIGLLVLQSSSSFILDSYQDLIREHLVVTLFLTMLVGAGGNAGNQSAIKVIRWMAMGSISQSLDSLTSVLKQQVAVALILGTSLSAAGWLRVYITNGDALNSSAIALSLFLIVCTSVIVGTLLPFGIARVGQDPANAGTSIQVLMDVLGVLITCTCCHYVLDEFATATL